MWVAPANRLAVCIKYKGEEGSVLFLEKGSMLLLLLDLDLYFSRLAQN